MIYPSPDPQPSTKQEDNSHLNRLSCLIDLIYVPYKSRFLPARVLSRISCRRLNDYFCLFIRSPMSLLLFLRPPLDAERDPQRQARDNDKDDPDDRHVGRSGPRVERAGREGSDGTTDGGDREGQPIERSKGVRAGTRDVSRRGSKPCQRPITLRRRRRRDSLSDIMPRGKERSPKAYKTSTTPISDQTTGPGTSPTFPSRDVPIRARMTGGRIQRKIQNETKSR